MDAFDGIRAGRGSGGPRPKIAEFHANSNAGTVNSSTYPTKTSDGRQGSPKHCGPALTRALRLWIPPAKRTQPVDSLLASPHSGSRSMVPGSTAERSSALSIGTTVDASPAKVGCGHHSRPPVGFPFNTTCLHSMLLIHSSIPCATHTSFVRTLSFEWPEQRRTRAS